MEEKLTRAKTYYKNGMASDALDILSEHLEEHPNDAASLELQGLILHSFQEYQRARQSIETAASIKALSPSAQLALADSYWFTEERSLATKLFNQLSRCDTLPSHLLPAIAKPGSLAVFLQYPSITLNPRIPIFQYPSITINILQ